MRFERVDGKMVRVSEKMVRVHEKEVLIKKASPNTITWNFPKESSYKSKRNLMDIPMMPVSSNKKEKGVFANSSIAFGSALVVGAVTTDYSQGGIFWEMFMTYLYPWFLDIATVYVAIKIAMGFYEEQRGGSKTETGFGTFLTYGKWLLLFHMIPFFVGLLSQLGTRMAEGLG